MIVEHLGNNIVHPRQQTLTIFRFSEIAKRFASSTASAVASATKTYHEGRNGKLGETEAFRASV